MAIDESKYKDIEFYSIWNIDRTIETVNATVSVDNTWKTIYTTNDGSFPKFYAFVLKDGRWYQAGYANNAPEFRSVQNKIQYKNFNTGTWRIKVYVLTGDMRSL